MVVRKLVVKVWCLPRQTEAQLQSLHRALVAATVTPDIGVKGENDMMVLFPPDMMDYGLGSEILVEVSHLPAIPPTMPYREYEALKSQLGTNLKMILEQRFPGAHVQGGFVRSDDF